MSIGEAFITILSMLLPSWLVAFTFMSTLHHGTCNAVRGDRDERHVYHWWPTACKWVKK